MTMPKPKLVREEVKRQRAELEAFKARQREEARQHQRGEDVPPVVYRLTRAGRAKMERFAKSQKVTVNKLAQTVLEAWLEAQA